MIDFYWYGFNIRRAMDPVLTQLPTLFPSGAVIAVRTPYWRGFSFYLSI
ncbi:MAG: hypothetical protein VYE01_03500 [Pseudomonadota bacterium]|nr:hypothetical protein [Pseudomonadota bacterium]